MPLLKVRNLFNLLLLVLRQIEKAFTLPHNQFSANSSRNQPEVVL